MKERDLLKGPPSKRVYLNVTPNMDTAMRMMEDKARQKRTDWLRYMIADEYKRQFPEPTEATE